MQTAFERAHGDQIVGTLTTVDRLIIHGHLTKFWHQRGFSKFLFRQGVRVPGFGRYAQDATEQVRKHAEKIAARAHRPFIYLANVVRGKDEMARAIARKDGITQGLVCVLSTLEIATSFAVCHGQVVPRKRRCLHLYFYLVDRELGFMHVRLQTWFPFQIQIWINGRERLARQLDKRRIGYQRYENTFLQIDDLRAAQKLCEGFIRRRLWRVCDVFARRANPLLPLIDRLGFGSYYWAIDACEIASDVMWKSRGARDRVSTSPRAATDRRACPRAKAPRGR